MKFLITISLLLTFLFSNEDVNKNETSTVKTSELELFLFKIGFESLLKDVEITKDKSSLNQEELQKLNNKVEIIMNEIYKDKRVLTTESSIVSSSKNINSNELKELRNEISLLKSQMKELQKSKKVKVIKKSSSKSFVTTIRVEQVNIRSKPKSSSSIVEILTKDTAVNIQWCNSYGWCKINGEEKYLAKFLLNL